MDEVLVLIDSLRRDMELSNSSNNPSILICLIFTKVVNSTGNKPIALLTVLPFHHPSLCSSSFSNTRIGSPRLNVISSHSSALKSYLPNTTNGTKLRFKLFLFFFL
jgi:hypothetical protein